MPWHYKKWDKTRKRPWECEWGTRESFDARDGDAWRSERKKKRNPPWQKAQTPKEEPQPPNEEPKPDEATINAAHAFWSPRERAKGRPCPPQVIESTRAGDDAYLLAYFNLHGTFSGAEVYIKSDIDAAASASRHGPSRCAAAGAKWWTSQNASAKARRSKYPLARVHDDNGPLRQDTTSNTRRIQVQHFKKGCDQ